MIPRIERIVLFLCHNIVLATLYGPKADMIACQEIAGYNDHITIERKRMLLFNVLMS
jgi:chemotaxis methyl-accepting protein methylase